MQTSTQTFSLPDRNATMRWGTALGALLRPGDVVALVGDLGAGKTTLTQAIARGMGLTAPVSSPTFTLAQEIVGRVPLFHFDAYRLERAEEWADLGFDEYLTRGGVLVVEWADRVAPLLPPERLTLTLEFADAFAAERADISSASADADEGPRRLIAEAAGASFIAVLEALAAQLSGENIVLKTASESVS